MHTGKFDGEPIPPETGLPAAIAARLSMLLLDAAETRYAAVDVSLLGRSSAATTRLARLVRAAVSVFLDGCRRGPRAQD
jgi:hypothetical protein